MLVAKKPKSRLRWSVLIGLAASTIAFAAPSTLIQDQILSSENRYFGSTLALQGDTAFVGSLGEVFVYNIAGTATLETAVMVNSHPSDIALSGNTVIIGDGDDSGAGYQAGAATVFERNNADWSFVAELRLADAPDADFSFNDGEFGRAVAIDGDYVVIGARGRDEGNGSLSGAAYVYERISGVWTQVAVLAASDGSDRDRFGNSVAISGNTIIIGAHRDDDVAYAAGSAYIFERNGGSWTEQAKITASDGIRDDEFADTVAINGNNMLIASRLGDVDGVFNAGSVYAYERSAGGSWTLIEKITAPSPSRTEFFGSDISLVDDKALLGAPGTGSAYLYSLQNGSWTLSDVLEASNSTESGDAVALSNDHALVSGDRYSSSPVYRYRLQLSADCVDSDGDGYGWDGTATCRVTNSTDQTGPGNQGGNTICVDIDGDGWGWDGTYSCRVEGPVVTTEETCFDSLPLGDGWGWNGTSSCRIEVSNPVCWDSPPLGDGWGWDGSDSCRL